MELLTTTLKDVDYKSREYPVALGTTASLLVAESRKLVPPYMPGATINQLEARVRDARIKEGEVGEVMESLNTGMEIQAFRGGVIGMVRGMALEWELPYAYGVLLSADVLSSSPAIGKPQDPQFSFELRAKIFNLGLTGRLLEDERGRRYRERLDLGCDIYDAFNLAVELHPQRVVAVDNHGNQTVVYEGGEAIGKKETLDKPGERVIYVFDEARREEWGLEELQVLPTSGLRVVFSGFYEKIREYARGAMLFGHKYSSAREFLEMVRVLDQHLIWDVCANFSSQYGGLDAPLIDADNRWSKKFPEYKNRLQLIPSRISLHFGRISLYFDQPTAIQALISLGDVVTDIWREPVDRSWDQGWDIVYDRQRAITPDHPVVVMGTTDAERYPVLKGD